jgi:hypothetical protein
MKAYVTNVIPSSLKNKLDKIALQMVNKRERYELFSEEYGLHIIELNNNSDPKIYRVEPAFETNYHLIKNHEINTSNTCDLLFDLTPAIHIPVVSQLPTNYVLTKMLQFSYKLDKKSSWTLIIDCIRETNLDTLNKELNPINYYFVFSQKELKEGKSEKMDINNNCQKELKEGTLDLSEINGFLSLLI